MAESFKVSDFIPAPPERVFSAWLNAAEHSKMSGGVATNQGDGRFTAWDGYISGRTVSSEPHSKIVQEWRTTQFPEGSPDSILTVLLESENQGTRLTLHHENLPDGQGKSYEQGWQEHYFAPMKAYFGSPLETVREVGEAISHAVEHAVEQVAEQVEAATEEAKQAVEEVEVEARKQAAKAVKAIKKVQEEAAAQLKAAGKKVKALVTPKKKPASKAKAKPKTKSKAKPKTKSKAKPKTKSKAKPKAKSKAQPRTKSKPKSQPKPKAKSKAQAAKKR